jgi:hypothetical protein
MTTASALAQQTATEPQSPIEGMEASADLLRQILGPDLVRLAFRADQFAAQAKPDSEPIETDTSKFPQGEVGEAARLTAPSGDLAALRDRLRRVLGLYYTRKLNTRDHNPWEMMHGIIAYGKHTEIFRGGPGAARANAIAYVCGNGPCHGLSLLFLDRGRVNARKGVYVQGHYGQLLAILAQVRTPLDYPLTVGDKSFTLADLLETEKYTCDDGMELTFKLIAFSHYCDSDVTWKNFKGDTWSIPRIIRSELAAPILSNAACGGTHRLTGYAYAVRNRKRQGKPIDGQWLRAAKYLEDYHRYTLALQNDDGSFSTEWFRRREARPDLDRRIQTTGHILEWLVYSVPAEQLDHPQVVKAVNYLTNLLWSEQSRNWEIGPLGHAIHALVLYDERRFKPFDDAAEVVNADPTPQVVGRPDDDSQDETAVAENETRQNNDDLDVREYLAGRAPSAVTGSVVPHEARRRAAATAEASDSNLPLYDWRRLVRPLLPSMQAANEPKPNVGARERAAAEQHAAQQRHLPRRVQEQRLLEQRALQQRAWQQQQLLQERANRQRSRYSSKSLPPSPGPEPVPAPAAGPVAEPVEIQPPARSPAPPSSTIRGADKPSEDGPALVFPE